jgi:methylmalonyl-CoA/ethylmalonyl-CoA epimerase
MAGSDFQIDRIGQIRVYVKDVDRATAFYRDVLGMRFLFGVKEQGLSFFDCGGVRLFMAVADSSTPAQTSVIYYDVDSVDWAYETLRSRGVEFIHEPQTVYTTDTAEGRMAFFKDSEDNTVAIMAERPLAVA